MAHESIHASFGMKIYLVLAGVIGAPLAILLAFLSHLWLDLFPERWTSDPNAPKTFRWSIGLDALLELVALLLIYFYFRAHSSLVSWGLVFAGIAGMGMDVADAVIHAVTGKNFFICHSRPRNNWLWNKWLNKVMGDAEFHTTDIPALATGVVSITVVLLAFYLWR